jgi:MFS family permease
MSIPTAGPDPRRWLALALLAVAQFVVVLDASIMNIALPSIGIDLGVSQESLSWIINAYVLTFGGFLLLGGRLADLLGRRRVFVTGLVLFALASLAGGLSETSSQLIAARAVQGLGGALLAPAALSILTTIFPAGAERNKALVPFRIFRLRTVAGANITMFIVGAAMFGLFYFLSLSMQQVLGYSALQAGLAQLPLAGVLILAAGVVAPLVTRLGSKPVTLGRARDVRGRARVVLADAGRRDVCCRPARPVAGGRRRPRRNVRRAHGQRGRGDRRVRVRAGERAHQYEPAIGGALGLAVLTAVATSRTEAVAGEVAPTVALDEGFQAGLLVAAVVVLVAVVLAALIGQGSRPSPGREELATTAPAAPEPA